MLVKSKVFIIILVNNNVTVHKTPYFNPSKYPFFVAYLPIMKLPIIIAIKGINNITILSGISFNKLK